MRRPIPNMPFDTLTRRLFSSRLPLLAVLLASLALVFHRSQTREIEPDEIEAMHSAWMIVLGERPYVDFIQQHHPLHYVVLAGVMSLAGEGTGAILAARALHFGFFLCTLGMVWLLASELFGRGESDRGGRGGQAARRAGHQVGLYALVLLCTSAVFSNKIIDVRPDVPMLLFGLVAIWAFLRHDRDRRHRVLVIGCVSLGLSFLFLQKTFFLMAALAVLSAARLAQRRMSLTELGVALGSLAAVLVPFFGMLVLSGNFDAYYAANWKVNADGSGGFGPGFWLLKNIRYSTVLWAFFALGVLFCSRTRRERELAFVTVAMLASLWLMKRPWPYYTLPMLPLMAVIAGRALSDSFGERVHLAHAAVLIGALPGLYFLKVTPYQWNGHRLAMIEMARAQTPPHERVHDGDCQFNIFRKPLDFYWYSLGDKGVMERFEKVLPRGYDRNQLFRRHQPRVVATRELEFIDPRIARHYIPSELDESISVKIRPFSFDRVAEATPLDR